MMYPEIDPVAIHIGSWGIRWYGLAYMAGFLWVYTMVRWSLKQRPLRQMTLAQVEAMSTSIMLFVLVGGRLGYMCFYQWQMFCKQPWLVFQVWRGGMSFHGAIIGGALGIFYYVIRYRIPFLKLSDLILPWVPLALGLGRLANFVNGELWGRPTHSQWGMIFPWVDSQLRHPSQLYEFTLEGLILSWIMWWGYRRSMAQGRLTGLFSLSYGCMRFIVEFFRQPDAQLGLLWGGHLSMGQCLSLPMIILGVWWLWPSRSRLNATTV